MPESLGCGHATVTNYSALAADEPPQHYPLDVPLAFARGYPQNPSCLLSHSGTQCTKMGARVGFLGRVHRKPFSGFH